MLTTSKINIEKLEIKTCQIWEYTNLMLTTSKINIEILSKKKKRFKHKSL